MFSTSDNYFVTIMQDSVIQQENKRIPTNALSSTLYAAVKKQIHTVAYLQAIGSKSLWKITIKRDSKTPLGYQVSLSCNGQFCAMLDGNQISLNSQIKTKAQYEFTAYLLSGLLWEINQ